MDKGENATHDDCGEKNEKDTSVSTVVTVDIQQYDEEKELKELRQLLFKIDIRIVILFSLCYLVSFMDRANIGNAKIAGLTEVTEITENGYNTGLSIFFAGYVIFELPSNMVLNKVGPRIWIAFIMIMCGGVLMAMAAVKNDAHLIATRFFLGVAEGGLFPGILVAVSVWYTKAQLTKRITIIICQSTIANAFGGLLGYGTMYNLEGAKGLHSWQWLFLIEGILTIAIGVAVFILLPSFPEKVLNERQLALFIKQMSKSAANHHIFEGDIEEKFSWKHLLLALKNYRLYIFCLVNISTGSVFYCNGLFLPSIVRGFGYTALNAQLMTIPPNAIASVFAIIVATSADYTKDRGYHIISSLILAILGFALLIGLKNHGSTALYVAMTLTVIGLQCSVSCCMSWYSCNFAGRIKRSISLALIVSCGNLGGVISGQMYRQSDAPQYIHGHTAALALTFCGTFLASLMKFILQHENTRRNKMSTEDRHQILSKIDANKLGDKHPDYRYLS
ncbi:major facilitator superfamily domain-containing protein [Phascolomyces articulosus]|uniref:Major facilitator superfamily domain-containing protein n=1 Tax=Phascolomyces articulosus TaxID=60185 RepID=A0AAD5KLF7_9FUNG|nr:major facilitator superfamily domain-containing protein [Phascolomyces articulosus]